MSDLIERQAAIDALEKEKPTPFVNKDGSIDPFGTGQQNQWYRDGIAIMNLPSAQPEIIRCKDCKWFGDIGCAISIADDSDKPTGNDFCSFAERREE